MTRPHVEFLQAAELPFRSHLWATKPADCRRPRSVRIRPPAPRRCWPGPAPYWRWPDALALGRDVELLVLEGALRIGDFDLRAGHYLFAAAGTHIASASSETGALALCMTAGSPDPADAGNGRDPSRLAAPLDVRRLPWRPSPSFSGAPRGGGRHPTERENAAPRSGYFGLHAADPSCSRLAGPAAGVPRDLGRTAALGRRLPDGRHGHGCPPAATFSGHPRARTALRPRAPAPSGSAAANGRSTSSTSPPLGPPLRWNSISRRRQSEADARNPRPWAAGLKIEAATLAGYTRPFSPLGTATAVPALPWRFRRRPCF